MPSGLQVCWCFCLSPTLFPELCLLLLMQDQDMEKCMQAMQSATLYGMPKLLACCEYSVALTALQSPQQGLLIERCRSEQLLARSWVCIAEGIRRAYHSLREETIQRQSEAAPCTCECCQILHSPYRSCSCSQPYGCNVFRPSPSQVRALLPGPREFLAMTMADKKA